jgi:hypothetical protein
MMLSGGICISPYTRDELPVSLFMRSSSRRLVPAFIAVVALGVASLPSHAVESPSSQSSLNDGYSLFYDFCSQESQLSLLLWFKSAPPDIADYAKRISATANDDMAILKKFSAGDSSLRLDKISLPPFELEVRKSMADDRKDQLIWKSSGASFAQGVLMTQSEVTNYGLHVAKILAETEPNSERAHAMQQMYAKWSALHAEAYKLSR